MGFNLLGLVSPLLKILERQGLVEPTPIQKRCIPIILRGRDLIGLAQTGTGKTVAFVLPLLNLMYKFERRGKYRPVRVIILSPTRELARQVDEVIKPYASGVNLKSVAVYGGVPIFRQFRCLRRGSDIVVGTPGRIEDHISKGTLDLSRVQFVVIDEADQMLDIGFLPAIKRICLLLPAKRQTLLFSATMSSEVRILAENYLNEPEEIRISRGVKPADNIEQKVLFLASKEKLFELQKILNNEQKKRILIFLRTKHAAEKIVKILDRVGFKVATIHGNKSQAKREMALKLFKEGKRPILIATDIAARGLDVPNVELVINFDLPDTPANYVHRIGRTARAGKSGVAISFCLPSEKDNLKSIEKLINQKLTKVLLEQAGHKPGQVPAANKVKNNFKKIRKDKLSYSEKIGSNNKYERSKKVKSRRLTKTAS